MNLIEARQIAERQADKFNENYYITKICHGNYTVCRAVDLNDVNYVDEVTPINGNKRQVNETDNKPNTNNQPCGCGK